VNRCTHRNTVTWVNLDATFDEQLLNVAVGQAISQVPADCDHDHLRREPEPGER
jgi:hypothetical protein